MGQSKVIATTPKQATFLTLDEVAQESAQAVTDRATTERLPRLDVHPELRERLLPLCRLQVGDVWIDPAAGHRVGVLDATRLEDVIKIMHTGRASLIINDPPYNIRVGNANTEVYPKSWTQPR